MPSAGLSIRASTSSTVTIDGRELVLFAGCDYLALAHHPRVKAALERGVAQYGLSSAGSRQTTGNTLAHDELERDLARFLGVEAALLVPDGYLSNLVFAQGLAPEIANVLCDRESHVSIRDALAAAGRTAREYEFVDASSAEQLARTIGDRAFAIVTDGIFPVLREVAPLAQLLAIVPRDGILVVDDCHGVGVLGANGRGSIEHAQIADPRIVVTGTLSKALGCFGGFIAGSRAHVERTRTTSRAYVGSTPIPPALACAASAALRVIADEPLRRARLFELTRRVRAVVARLGLPVASVPFPVFAFRLENGQRVQAVHEALRARGLLVPSVHYPDGQGDYLRLALRADHSDEQVAALVDALQELLA